MKFPVGSKLLGRGVQPGIHLGVDNPERRLQLRGVAFRIVHKKTRIHTEKTRQKRACAVRKVGPRAALDLRKVSLAEAAAHFTLHGFGQLQLRHGTAKATKRTFDRAKRTEFVAESHGETSVLQYANTLLLFAMSVKNYICPVFLCLGDDLILDRMANRGAACCAPTFHTVLLLRGF